MELAACIAYVLIVAAVIAWLLYEMHLDRKSEQARQPTVPGPRERLPVKSDV